MSLLLRDPGLLSLLVDHGRPAARALGVPVGGAADRAALALANALVGNPPDALGLEFTLSGLTIEATTPTACAMFGAPFTVTAGRKPVAAGGTFTLEARDTLRIGGTPTGVRGYLCVAGGFAAPVVLGSRSSLDPLTAGTVLECRPSRCAVRGLGFVALAATSGNPSAGEPGVSTPGSPITLRVLDGPQRDWFSDDRFIAQVYEVSTASNRMGLRLVGEPLVRRPGELVSEAVAPGAVQITNDGRPVVLGVDGQTIGGYPKIAHVIRADLDRLAQLRPGEKVRFARVTPEEAEVAARERAAALRVWLARLRAADREPTFA
jgi:biotin-dependent carboxylase-like uncharacterized protein